MHHELDRTRRLELRESRACRSRYKRRRCADEKLTSVHVVLRNDQVSWSINFWQLKFWQLTRFR
jgi:hypothetical protein